MTRCDACELIQLTYVVDPDRLFRDYAYLTSFSDTATQHAKVMADSLVERFALDSKTLVVEVASNDGYLLRPLQERGVSVLGIEPARNVAAVARERGVPTLDLFFGVSTATDLVAEYGHASLVIGNNVLAHVADIRDFLEGVSTMIGPAGAAVFEFPWLSALIRQCEFDTIYHEHVFYLSLAAVRSVCERTDLEVFDAEFQDVHGGSLRVFVQKPGVRPLMRRVGEVLRAERDGGLNDPGTLSAFAVKARSRMASVRDLLKGLRATGAQVSAYGAPAKGNTLLNGAGITSELVSFTVDRNPLKQGRFLPGSGIPIHHPDHIAAERPDYVLVLPWNLLEEITGALSFVREWGGKFVVPIPEPRVLL